MREVPKAPAEPALSGTTPLGPSEVSFVWTPVMVALPPATVRMTAVVGV
jgi:hypothetical protein